MNSFQRWIPLVAVGVILAMFALSWLPTGQLSGPERNAKPWLAVTLNYDEGMQSLHELATDIESRLDERHEFRLADGAHQATHELHLHLLIEDDTVSPHLLVIAELYPKGAADAAYRFEVAGAAQTAANLANRTVRLSTDYFNEDIKD